ncbi:MAG: cation-translocating P-type ATPase [Candidatus Bathyarchaeia archaeon]
MNKQKSPAIKEVEFILNEDEAFRLPLADISKKLKTNLENGLTRQEATERLQKTGPNCVPKIAINRLKMYLAPLSNWLIVVYLIVSTALAVLALVILPSLWFQVAVWLPIITGNVVVIVVQSVRAERGLTALQKLSSPKCNVKRDGKVTLIPSEELVPGDIILLKQGDIIPADARVITSVSLRANEAILTGESADVEKSQHSTSEKEGTSIFQKHDSLFLGTSIVTGNATAMVVETGRNTQIGKMAGKLKIDAAPEISLRKRINVLAKNLTYIVLIYLGLSITFTFGTMYLTGSTPNVATIAQAIANALITALNIMPVSIPLLVTIVMLAGALIMVKSNVIVRNLNAIESAGRLSVLCTDKTGTITQNKMTVKWVYTPIKQGQEKLYYVTSPDSVDAGRIAKIDITQGFDKVLHQPQEFVEPVHIKIEEENALEYLLAASLLNNDRPIFGDDESQLKACQIDTSKKITSDATDIAMLCLFERAILEPEMYTGRFTLLTSWPLDPKTKLITKVFHDTKTNRFVFFVKGSIENLLIKCSTVLCRENEVEPFTQDYKNQVLDRVDLFSQQGQRIVSFALREVDDFDESAVRELCETCLTFIGFVAITDPPREGVSSAVSELNTAGIKPVMITGDSLATARSIAKEIGLIKDNQLVVEGSQIGKLSDEEFLNVAVFARTSPDDKRAIVARYKELNCVVAMTGDGVNDAQAIVAADVGIAMGATGTDVARQSAGVVLADDSFNSIVTGIRQGRGVFEKIQNIVFFYVAISIAEALVFFGASFVKEFFILQTWQLIYIAITQFAPSLALVTDKLSPDVMKEKPRSKEGLISGKRRTALIVFSLSLALMLTISYLLALFDIIPVFGANEVGHVLGSDIETPSAILWEQAKARTMLLSVAIIAQSVLILSLRRLNKPMYKSLREDWNWKIMPLVLSIPVFHAMLMYIPQMQYGFAAIGINFEILPLTVIDWSIVLALGLAPVALLELTKMIWSRKDKIELKPGTH